MDGCVITIVAKTQSGFVARKYEGPVTLTTRGADVNIIGENPVYLESGEKELVLTAAFESGEAFIRAEAEGLTSGEASLVVVPDYGDSDGDGFPDVVELSGDTDRLNFRRWFCAVAESQLFEKNRRWSDVTTDCAGFIRFCYIEALKSHHDEFFASYSALVNPANPDVKKYNYPNIPLVGTNAFRAREGAFSPEDIPSAFTAAATAKAFLLYNVVPLGRGETNLAGALPGDLLFYFNPDNPSMPYHMMIYLGEWGRTEDDDSGDELDWVIYHTGPRRGDPGEVRKLRLATLAGHPEERWRPVKNNDHFLGYFRFKVLD